MKHRGKVVAITGGASGIGYAFAQRWIAEGGKTVLLDRNEEALETAVSSLAPNAVRAIACDISIWALRVSGG